MGTIWQGLVEAFHLLIAGDREVLDITLRTFQVSSLATLIAVVLGVPIGTFLGLRRFAGRKILVSLVNFGMGLPPVIVGLVTWLILTRYGPLGFLGLIYTPAAMVMAQAAIALPMVAGFTLAAIQSLNPKLRWQILALGADHRQLLWLLLREARLGLLAAVIAGFGAVISEVGASMMVGGNVQGLTRVLTTSIAMEISRGRFELAAALSAVLLILSFLITGLLTALQQHRRHPQ